jgi:hypothetical protein
MRSTLSGTRRSLYNHYIASSAVRPPGSPLCSDSGGLRSRRDRSHTPRRVVRRRAPSTIAVSDESPMNLHAMHEDG